MTDTQTTHGLSGETAAAARQFTAERDYWLQKLSGEPVKTPFPYDYKQVKEPPKLQELEFQWPHHISDGLMKLGNKSDYRLHMILTAAVTALVYRYSGNTDIIVGSPIFKQKDEDHTRFTNTILPLRHQLTGEFSFKELLLMVRETIGAAVKNQAYSIRLLMEELGMSYTSAEFELFDVAVLLENIQDIQYFQGISPNTCFSFLRKEESVSMTVRYNTLRYREDTVRQIAGHLETLLKQVLADVNLAIPTLPLLSEQEKDRILFDFNRNETDFPKDRALHYLFEEQVEKSPHHIAVIHGDQQVTYHELNNRVNKLAHLLRTKGVGPDVITGLLMDRSIDMMIGILGILKAGGAYLPLDPGFPVGRLRNMLEDCESPVLLTQAQHITPETLSFTGLQNIQRKRIPTCANPRRPQIKDLDNLPYPDRGLVDYEKYSRFIGQTMAKNSITLQATRGCPYNCAYCHKIWPKSHVYRSAEHIFEEVKLYYDMGIRRFAFIDDVFNLNKENSTRFFRKIIDNNMKIQIFFPAGLRGDILTPDYIDLMIEAGTSGFGLALETASPRLQKLIGKNLRIEKLRENLNYITTKHPHAIVELFLMAGFPSETKEEALTTLQFLKDTHWIDFPYLSILNIYPDTDMEKIALAHGVSQDRINLSEALAFHDLPSTLPFEKSFMTKFQADFLNDYFLRKDRLLAKLPHQMKTLTEDELVQKYNSYLPIEITCLDDLLDFTGITHEELGTRECVDESIMTTPDLGKKIIEAFPRPEPAKDAFKVLLLDLSQFFVGETVMLFDVVEPPLGLMYLLTYLNHKMGDKVHGKIAKPRTDFNNFDEFRQLIEDFQPDVIGVRTLTFYKDFFHKCIALIRQWGFDVPIIAGGPYATSSFNDILQDRHIHAVVLGEGEVTFHLLIEAMIANGGAIPPDEVLEKMDGVVYIPSAEREKKAHHFAREVILSDYLNQSTAALPAGNPGHINQPGDLAYAVYTSGSTGIPKAVLTQHANVIRVVRDTNYIHLGPKDRILQLSNYAFDGSVFDIFGAFLNGSSLVLLQDEGVVDIEQLSNTILDRGIDIFFVTTALFNALVELNADALKHIDRVLYGGERVSVEHAKKALQTLGPGKIIHMYGPTETTVYASFYYIDEIDERLGTIPIGGPLANTTIYILDKHFRPVPLGVGGEICIGGPGLARGYLNNPEMTAEKFVPHPLTEGERVYRSGDLARRLPGGYIEFIGREDHQVKIRGFRIEIGEIESTLLKNPDIKEAFVLAEENERGDRYLCAFTVSGRELADTEITEMLSKELPEYMLPSYFVQLEKMPLTPQGKVDVRALPGHGAHTPSAAYVAPSDIVEEKLAHIWSEILAIDAENISIDDDFFTLGGHSLRTTVLVSRIAKELHVKIPLTELFRLPTVRELAGYIRGAKKEAFVPIKTAPKKDFYCCSSAQKRLYVLQQMEPRMINYNIPVVMKVDGPINLKKWSDIFEKLVRRHHSLRTAFVIDNQVPVQIVHESIPFRIDYSEPTDTSEEGTAAEINRFIQPFDLSRPPLFRVGFVRLEPGKHILLVDMHHIISDGTSHGLLLGDFLTLYAGELLPPPKLQYKDYAEWQNSPEEQQALKEQEDYWLSQFHGELPLPDLPIDFPRPAVRSFAGSTFHFTFGGERAHTLKNLALSNDVTLYMLMLSAYVVLLSKLSGREDIITGTVVSGRRHEDLRSIIGMFVNTLGIRTFPERDKNMAQFLQQVKKRSLDAFENQEYPFEELVEKIQVNRDPGRNPLFDNTFGFQNVDIPKLETADLTFNPFYSKQTTSKFDLTLVGTEADDEISFTFEYCTRLFKEETIERFTEYFKRLVSALPENLKLPLPSIDIIPPGEKQTLLREFNDVPAVSVPDKTIHQLFQEQVDRVPDRIAAVGNGNGAADTGDDPRIMHITYRELNRRANRMAAHLQEKGLCAGHIAAVLLERSVDLITALPAIIKTGAAYLPIDPAYPDSRKHYMVRDSAARVLVTHTSLLPRDPEASKGLDGTPRLLTDEFSASAHRDHGPGISAAGSSGDIFYIIYTSGTTGRPKGVPVEHKSFVNLVACHREVIGENPSSRISQVAGPAFDAMASEVWPCLLNGAALCIAGNDVRADAARLKQWLISRAVTISFQPTVMGEYLLKEQWPQQGVALQVLRVAGDRLTHFPPPGLPFKLLNLYGPTEDTVWTTWTRVSADDRRAAGERPAIGKPVSNHRVYVLGSSLELQPAGVPGELCVSGIGVTRGYLNRPELTAEKFIPLDKAKGALPGLVSWIDTPPPSPLYRTGDLVRRTPEGNLQFLGRIDQQVKIRGYRVEPEEIEVRLTEYPGVKEAAVIQVEDGGEIQLAAYTVITDALFDDDENWISKLKHHLSRFLPPYMVPLYVTRVPRIPITTAGKIDRKALPKPGALTPADDYIPPEGEIEETLVNIWSEVLGLEKERIGAGTHFFHSGGHSLKGTILLARVYEELNLKIPLAELFKYPTIRGLANVIGSSSGQGYTRIEPAPPQDAYPLSYNQRRVWLALQATPGTLAYNMPGQVILDGSGGETSVEAAGQALAALIEHHESFRTYFTLQGDTPVQKIREHVENPLQVFDISHLDGAEKEERRARHYAETTRYNFDLAVPPLFKAAWVKLDDTRADFIFNIHHIVSDGWSMEILTRDFFQLYRAYRKDEPAQLPSPAVQYKDFAHWQNQRLNTPEVKTLSHGFWLERLQRPLPPLNLPGRKEGSYTGGESAAYRTAIPTDALEALQRLAEANNTGIFIVLYSIFNLVLARLSGQKEIPSAILGAGRENPQMHNVVGFFVNTMLLLNTIDYKEQLSEFIQRVNREAMDMVNHQEYPLELVLEDLGIRFPEIPFLFNMFNLENNTANLDIESFGPVHRENVQDVKFDIVMYVSQFKNGIEFQCHFRKQRFPLERIEYMMREYLKVIDKIAANPTHTVEDYLFEKRKKRLALGKK